MAKHKRMLMRNRIIVVAIKSGRNPKEIATHLGISIDSIWRIYKDLTGESTRRPAVWRTRLQYKRQTRVIKSVLELFPKSVFEPFDEPEWQNFGMVVIQ